MVFFYYSDIWLLLYWNLLSFSAHFLSSCLLLQDVVPHNNQSSSQSPFAQGTVFRALWNIFQIVTEMCAPAWKSQNRFLNTGNFGFEAASGSSGVPSASAGDGLQCTGWKAPPTATTASFQPAVPPWSSSDYNQPDPSAQTLAYPATPALTADVYMQTLCPSYTMLTYTHTPLLTNIGVSDSEHILTAF